MNRISQFSKETEDKVKLAKQFIENKYQGIIQQQQEYKMNWMKIINVMNKCHLQDHEKKQITEKIVMHENAKKRLMRQKDSLKNYQLHRVIGKGAFGEVRLAKNITNNEIVAIKRMEKKRLIGKKQISGAYLEREFLINNQSQFLVELKSTFQDRKYLYIVMEYISGGDLLHLLIEKDIFTEDETRFYIAEMILAIEEIHKMDYIHRDIKPDNILISKTGHIKISDFGLSKYVHDILFQLKQTRAKIEPLTKIHSIKKHSHLKEGRNRKFSKVGTPDYISPEILTNSHYDHQVDIWSVGVIMFECLFGYPPFSHEDSKEVCMRVMNWVEFLEFPEDTPVSLEAKMLILGMMNDRSERLTIHEIKNHPFFANFKWKDIMKATPPFIPPLKDNVDTQHFQQFDEENDWLQEGETDLLVREKDSNQETTDGFNQKERSNSLSSPFYFAGFQYQRHSHKNIFDETIKELEGLNRQKFRVYKSKSPTKKKFTQVMTEQSIDATIKQQGKWNHFRQNRQITKDSLKSLKLMKENVQSEDAKKVQKSKMLKKKRMQK